MAGEQPQLIAVLVDDLLNLDAGGDGPAIHLDLCDALRRVSEASGEVGVGEVELALRGLPALAVLRPGEPVPGLDLLPVGVGGRRSLATPEHLAELARGALLEAPRAP